MSTTGRVQTPGYIPKKYPVCFLGWTHLKKPTSAKIQSHRRRRRGSGEGNIFRAIIMYTVSGKKGTNSILGITSSNTDKFSGDCKNEKKLKIGQYLMKLCLKYYWFLFFRTRCRLHASKATKRWISLRGHSRLYIWQQSKTHILLHICR